MICAMKETAHALIALPDSRSIRLSATHTRARARAPFLYVCLYAWLSLIPGTLYTVCLYACLSICLTVVYLLYLASILVFGCIRLVVCVYFSVCMYGCLSLIGSHESTDPLI